ncbi:hypothetical protein KAR91_70220 [Candidatus Pacearchaeota archaeon]|nr:hypothetical protein [Candidatus Pacearchaeota archaeon]
MNLMLPVSTPKNYSEMLNKIFVWTFIVACFAIFLLKTFIPKFGELFGSFSSAFPSNEYKILGLLPTPLGIIIPALALGVFFRIIKMHDLFSSIFRIRMRFDVNEILLPLALGSEAQINIQQIKQFKSHRKQLMSSVFFSYASSTNPKIDEHLIHMALDSWSWYWIIVESIVIAVLTAVLAIYFEAYKFAVINLMVIFLGQAVLMLLRKRCVRYAIDEVEQILSNNTRKLEIKGVFDDIQS